MSDHKYYNLSIEETAELISGDLQKGLSEEEAKNRFLRFGPNRLEEKKAISPLKIFLEQFQGFNIWVLVGAALVSGFLREWVDASAILATGLSFAITLAVVYLPFFQINF